MPLRREKSHTVGYRIGGKHLSLLEKRAAKNGNVSVHEEARRLLIERLESSDLETVLQRLEQLEDSVRGVSEELGEFRGDLKQALAWIVKRLNELTEAAADDADDGDVT